MLDVVAPKSDQRASERAESGLQGPAARSLSRMRTDAPGLSVGKRPPKVECSKHTEGSTTVTHTMTCRTMAGKDLPLSDCCLNPNGSKIPACEPKPQPTGQ
jgi:hypothetical protein